MTSYTEIFGGNTIYPSDVSYLALALATDTTLGWPQDTNAEVIAARIIDITPTGAHSITMPDARLAGVGATILFNNLGPSTVTVKKADGSTLLSLSAGEQWQVYLTDNSTVAGSWRTFRYGASTAQAQASALAGYGLSATGSTLSQNSPVTELAANYALGAADRASTFVWTDGAGTITTPSAASAGSGWFVNIRNAGFGDVTIDPAGLETIDGAATLVLHPGDSATIVAGAGKWYTIGLGQQPVFAFDYTSIDLTGKSSPYTLSGAELNRIAYRFVGTLTANMEIIVPSTVQQYWASNTTTGPYTLGLRTSTQPSPILVGQNQRAILYSDGANVVDADTSGVAIPLSIAEGGTGATTASGARVALGGTSLGVALFTATSTNVAWTALGVAPAGTVNGGTF